ncbi:hypothetical protein RFI_40209, partial [Reticulomyxa filosa]
MNNRLKQLEKEAMSNLSIEKNHTFVIGNEANVHSYFQFQKQHKSGMSISQLALQLEKESNRIGKMIVAEHNIFKEYFVSLFNVKTQSHGIEDKSGRKKHLNDVKKSNEYEECCKVLKDWSALLNKAIKDMLNDIQTFESHGYQVSNDKIGYKEQDKNQVMKVSK